MKIYSYSKWQYDLDNSTEDIDSRDDAMECVSCDDEIGMGYVVADRWDFYLQINTDKGQQCGNCLALFLSTTNHDITPFTILNVNDLVE